MNKGIVITQKILDQNNHNWLKNKAVGEKVVPSRFPSKFWVTEKIDSAYEHRTELHGVDGWKEVIREPLGIDQKYGEIVENENGFTYPAIDKSTEELQNEKISNAQFQKEELVRTISEEKIIAEAQEETDDAWILDNQALYPLWGDMPDGFEFKVDNKYQDFVDGELKAFRVLQAHSKQANYNPINVPALFAKVNYPGQIEDWEERTGENTYKIGDKVYWPIGSTTVYRSTINNNSWSPEGYPQGWELVTV